MEEISYHVNENDQHERLDKVLAKLNEEWSRSQVQQWIKEDRVKINGNNIKSNYKCQAGDEIIIYIPEPKPLEALPEEMGLDIYYEDSDVLVVNKPKGLVVHPAPGHLTGTLVNGLMAHCNDLSGINGVLRPGIVHRIDKDTSGLLMVAKNDFSHERLVDQLVHKTVVRRYKAIVHGIIEHEKGTIDAPIGRDPSDRQKMTVTESNSKDAITHFQVIERFKDFTFIECRLETGRTHQIRVHMKYIGFPLLGDPKYGPRKTWDIGGQALHAGVLGFEHPRTNEHIQFEAPLPDEFADILDKLQKEVDNASS